MKKHVTLSTQLVVVSNRDQPPNDGGIKFGYFESPGVPGSHNPWEGPRGRQQRITSLTPLTWSRAKAVEVGAGKLIASGTGEDASNLQDTWLVMVVFVSHLYLD